MKRDYLVRGTIAGGQANATTARTTALVEEARCLHGAWPTASAALGRTLTAAALMAASLDSGQRLTLQILGDGPLGRILAIAAADGRVKGYLDEPHVHLPLNERGKLDVAGAVGHTGMLYVLQDLGLKEAYRGMTPLVSGEIGLDMAEYFHRSEQVPSAVGLGVMVDVTGEVRAAGGFLLRMMPGASEVISAGLEANLAGITSVTELIAAGATPEKIMRILAGDLPFVARGRLPLRYSCGCNRDRFVSPLLNLGRAELSSILAERGRIELRCHFCQQVYTFFAREIEALLSGAEEAGESTPPHE